MTIYNEYAILEAQIKVLEEQKDSLRVKILRDMVDKGENKIDTEIGKFSIVSLKKWEYPIKVLKIGEEFKAAKAKAESTGEATYTENSSLRFSPLKL